MNTQRLTTILASAYVSAMLASSVAPIRSDATLAATIDPTAAQQAFQNAVNGLNVNGWLAASTTPSAPKVATATASATRLTVDPVMTEELKHFGALLQGPAAKEAISAVMEKRKPDFSKC